MSPVSPPLAGLWCLVSFLEQHLGGVAFEWSERNLNVPSLPFLRTSLVLLLWTESRLLSRATPRRRCFERNPNPPASCSQHLAGVTSFFSDQFYPPSYFSSTWTVFRSLSRAIPRWCYFERNPNAPFLFPPP